MDMKYNVDDYPYTIRSLSEEEGGGFFIEYPDLPGCYSDGKTVLEARDNGREAAYCWLATAIEDHEIIPAPGSSSSVEHYSGRLSQRVPKSVHLRLEKRAKDEGVSVNQLVLFYIAEGLVDRPNVVRSRSFSSKRRSRRAKMQSNQDSSAGLPW